MFPWWLFLPIVIHPNPTVDVGGVKPCPRPKPDPVASVEAYHEAYTCRRCGYLIEGSDALPFPGEPVCRCTREQMDEYWDALGVPRVPDITSRQTQA